eukprot:5934589-Prymnesium_polylepis.2
MRAQREARPAAVHVRPPPSGSAHEGPRRATHSRAGAAALLRGEAAEHQAESEDRRAAHGDLGVGDRRRLGAVLVPIGRRPVAVILGH